MGIYLRILLVLFSLFCWSLANAEDELNLKFIYGGTQDNIPDIFRSDVLYPSGEYLVDVYLNNNNTKRQVISISPEDSTQLCLSLEWLESAGIFIIPRAFSSGFNSDRKCYVLTDKPDTKVIFNHGGQRLEFTIPQAYLDDTKIGNGTNWDFGSPAFKFSYMANANKSNGQKKQAYGNFDTNLNLSRWVLGAKAYAFSNSRIKYQDVTLSTALSSIRGDFILGKTQTISSLLDSIIYTGVALRSNSKMLPMEYRGYAPVISGVVNNSARITVEQSGNVLTSYVVPAGAYDLRDIKPITNGDLTVRIVEDNGVETVRIYPVTTLPTLLRSKDFNYNFVFGSKGDYGLGFNEKNTEDELKGNFALASIDYGFDWLTLNSALIYHKEYRGGGLGMTFPIGFLGAISLSGNSSQITSDTIDKKGYSAAVKYSKNLGVSTNIQLASYEYIGDNYYEFQQYYPGMSETESKRKNRYELTMTHGLANVSMNAQLWQQTYREQASDIGAGFNISSYIDKVSVAVGVYYNDYSQFERSDYQTTLSVSIPFQYNDNRAYSSSSLSYSRENKTFFNTSLAGNLQDNINYTISGSKGNKTESASAYMGVKFNAMQTGASISRSNQKTTYSGNVSGSLLATPESGVLLTSVQSNSLAIARVKNTKGIKINGSRPTNSRGYTVIPINEYGPNILRINADNLSDDVELLDSTFNVVPTEKAVIYREFGVQNVKRYILRLLDSAGNDIPRGLIAKTNENIDAGFIADNGVLLMSLLSEPKLIKVIGRNGFECSFAMQGIISNNQNIQEVICE